MFGLKDGIEEAGDESEWESVDEEDEAHQPTASGSMTYTISNSKLYRAGLFAVVLALMLPIIQMISIAPLGVYGSSIPRGAITSIAERSTLVERADSQTEVCKRWSGQSAIVNGTLYMYGFRTTTDAQQKSGTWSELPTYRTCAMSLTIYSKRFLDSRSDQVVANLEPFPDRSTSA